MTFFWQDSILKAPFHICDLSTVTIIMKIYDAPKLLRYTTTLGAYNSKSFTYKINQHTGMHTRKCSIHAESGLSCSQMWHQDFSQNEQNALQNFQYAIEEARGKLTDNLCDFTIKDSIWDQSVFPLLAELAGCKGAVEQYGWCNFFGDHLE